MEVVAGNKPPGIEKYDFSDNEKVLIFFTPYLLNVIELHKRD